MKLKTLDDSNRSQVIELLESNGLPTADIDMKSQYFIGLMDNNELIAMGALEVFGEHALLRSIAVNEKHRKQGLGTRIVAELLTNANQRDLQSLYLLTLTAKDFFTTLDFKIIHRSEVPDQILKSKEFTSLCPDSAVCMKKDL